MVASEVTDKVRNALSSTNGPQRVHRYLQLLRARDQLGPGLRFRQAPPCREHPQIICTNPRSCVVNKLSVS